MAMFTIDGYSLRLWPNRPATHRGPGMPVAGIYLYQGDVYRGYVYFFPHRSTLAPAAEDAVNGRIFLHQSLSGLHQCLDILRSGDPAHVYYFGPDNADLQAGCIPAQLQERAA